jgi:hypothetical protein
MRSPDDRMLAQRARRARSLFFYSTILLFRGLIGNPTTAIAVEVGAFSDTCVAPNWQTGIPEAVPDQNSPVPLGGYFGFTTPRRHNISLLPRVRSCQKQQL